mmetsp:Transcript_46398/g.99373  ORF Transcript_46398/g.99373 Transcript_46398/m.99373 type:complete len:85 (-) Transcript_46398:188-442(-)
MRDMLRDAGFRDIQVIAKKEAADIIKDWIPGSGAEKFVTSVYVTAIKPVDSWGHRDNVRAAVVYVPPPIAEGGDCGAGGCGPGA